MDAVEARVTIWRAAFEAEAPRVLTSHAPPVVRTIVARRDEFGKVIHDAEGRTVLHIRDDTEPGAVVGMPLSGAMLRLLGHEEGYGMVYPTRRALYEWRKYCHRNHRRWRDHRTDKSLCGTILIAVVRDRRPVRRVANDLEISYFRTVGIVREALEWMSNRQAEWVEASPT